MRCIRTATGSEVTLENPVWAALLLAVALFSTWTLGKFAGPPPAANRFASIDGLRGYLAFAVFIHHAAIWFQYLRTGAWPSPAPICKPIWVSPVSPSFS